MHAGSVITLDQKSALAPWSASDAVFQTFKVTNNRYAIRLYTPEHRSLQKLALCIESVPMSHYIRPNAKYILPANQSFSLDRPPNWRLGRIASMAASLTFCMTSFAMRPNHPIPQPILLSAPLSPANSPPQEDHTLCESRHERKSA